MQQQEEITVDSILSAPGGYDAFVRGMFNRSGDPSKDFAHAVLGIFTEIHEMRKATDDVNRLEEAGDLKFYAHAIAQVICDLGGMAQLVVEESLKEVYGVPSRPINAERLDELRTLYLDEAKAWIGYGRLPKEPLRTAVVLVLLALAEAAQACPDYEVSSAYFERLERINVAKLLDRYKGKHFNADRAVNRDLASERKVLEDAAAS